MTAQPLPVQLSGTTLRFKGDGRRLGYPTANLAISTDLEDGVYFGFANMSTYMDQPALIFVGSAVTTGDLRRRVEAHLLDIADHNYYELELDLDIRHFHRTNKKFASLAELTKAMQADEAAARDWFKTHTLA